MTNQTHPQEVPELVERLRKRAFIPDGDFARTPESVHELVFNLRKLGDEAADLIEKLQSPSPGGERPAAAMPSKEVLAPFLAFAADMDPSIPDETILTATKAHSGARLTYGDFRRLLKLTPSHSGETGEVERLRGAIQHEINLLRRADSPWAIGIRKRLKGALKNSPGDGGLS